VASGQAVKRDTSSELAIFARLIRVDGSDLSRELARYILTVGFDEEDQRKMTDLAERNQERLLSGDEKAELEGFVKAGHLLALLHSKARMALKAEKARWARNGSIAFQSTKGPAGATFLQGWSVSGRQNRRRSNDDRHPRHESSRCRRPTAITDRRRTIYCHVVIATLYVTRGGIRQDPWSETENRA
jgi:hypothetical protein